ncbi:hypothetical protein LCGC14_0163580 [marine sediment metagenome]|uniref:Uncharacterized protein n=1 Tax=marine sediment metagenome TaxID=412755 RepID=A0A0F9UYB1_9ZZZZ
MKRPTKDWKRWSELDDVQKTRAAVAETTLPHNGPRAENCFFLTFHNGIVTTLAHRGLKKGSNGYVVHVYRELPLARQQTAHASAHHIVTRNKDIHETAELLQSISLVH